MGMSAGVSDASGMERRSAGGAPPSHLPVKLPPLGQMLRDRVTILSAFWVIVAFVLRPMLEAAHYGRGGPLEGFYHDMGNPLGFAMMFGFSQWLSMALPVVLIGLLHVRLSFDKSPEVLAWRGVLERWAAFPLAYTLALALGYLAFFWSPATTFTKITHDSFIFFDASYRILNGETPHIDFPTVLGAATLYLPAIGSWLADGYAGSVELASVPVAIMAGLAIAHSGVGRYPSGVTSALVLISFLVAVPATVLGLPSGSSHTFIGGEPVVLSEGLSHAMFYNRWGWALLIPMFAYLAPRTDAPAAPAKVAPPWLSDALVMAVILAFLFYTKITFFVVGGASAVLYAFLNPKPWRTLAVGVGVSLLIVLAVGFSLGILGPYLQELWTVAQISGGKSNTLLEIIRENLPLMLVAVLPLGALVLENKFTWRDAVIGGFMMLMSLWTIVQNAQLSEIITLSAVSAYGVARFWSSSNAKLGRYLVVSAFMISTLGIVFNRSIAVVDQAIASRREEVREPAPWADLPAMRGIYIAERENAFKLLQDATNDIELLEAYHYVNRMGRKESMRQGEYMVALMEGMQELEAVMRPGDSVATLDMANPFPFLMHARSPRGSYITLDADRTISERLHPDPEVLFADTDHVMIPRAAMLQHTIQFVNEVYGDWLTENYEQREETIYWTRYSFKRSEIAASTLNLR